MYSKLAAEKRRWCVNHIWLSCRTFDQQMVLCNHHRMRCTFVYLPVWRAQSHSGENWVYWPIELLRPSKSVPNRKAVCVCVIKKIASHACCMFPSTQRVGVVSVRPSWFAMLVQWRFSVYKVIRVLRVPPRLTEVRLIYVSISGEPL